MLKTVAALVLAAALGAPAAQAQTANSAPTSAPGVGGNVSRAPPSVGGAAGQTGAATGQAGAAAPTPLDRTEEQRSQKTTSSVCKGC